MRLKKRKNNMDNKLKCIKEDETIDDLQLKNLNLIQKKDGFKFGVDAVLLSDFACIKKKHRVMDLCTGTGIIPYFSNLHLRKKLFHLMNLILHFV